MSFAGTSFPATTSIVIVAPPTVKSKDGPQAGGVYWPLKLKTLLSADAAADARRTRASAQSGRFMASLLVLELTAPDLAAFEAMSSKISGDKDWEAHYQRFVPLVDSGHREIFKVVE